jgi:hypothetical protein
MAANGKGGKAQGARQIILTISALHPDPFAFHLRLRIDRFIVIIYISER